MIEAAFTLAEIDRVASEIAPRLKFGEDCILTGGLGAGKTTLAASLVKALGGKAQETSSPTYVLQHLHAVSGGRTVEHWDLYRVSGAPEELSERPPADTLRLIEWGEKFDDIAGAARFRIVFSPAIPEEGPRSLVFMENPV